MFWASLLLNSILLNSEAWYSPPIKDIEKLEKVDCSLLRIFLEAPIGTPNCMLYLELGCIPICFLVKQRRLMFLHYFLQQDTLLFKVLNSQIEESVKGDWIEQIYTDIEEVGIIWSLEEIQRLYMTSLNFKNTCSPTS